MNGLKTFPAGGIRPPDGKSLSCNAPIKNAIVPSVARVPLLQHLGTPAFPVVHVGDRVREGMLIGRPDGIISAAVHSPIPGVVVGLEEIGLLDGRSSLAVVIALDGVFDRSGRRSEARPERQPTLQELADLLRANGVVGLGGTSFPTHLKFAMSKGVRIEHLVVNGVECEPYLTADHRLMIERTREILKGVQIAASALNPLNITVGIDENKPDAIRAMTDTSAGMGIEITVVPVESKYPQGDEKQLLKALLGREVPSGGLPLDVGAVVLNVATLHALYDAVALDKPLFERVVTMSGGALRSPANLKARVGTPIGALIQECGGFLVEPARLVAGGPLTGRTILDLDTPLTKGISAIIALTSAEARTAPETACISCGRCVEVCPMGLDPATLFKQVEHDRHEEALEGGLLDCRECGCCSYVCPARLPIVDSLRLGKRMARFDEEGC